MRAYRFRPIDTWFFKEARPMEGFGGTELASTFPPPVRTLMGALRTAIGDTKGVAWENYPQDYPKLVKLLGDATSYGTLEAEGLFLQLGDTPLYPMPMHIVHIDKKKFAKMSIGDTVECDLGNIRLPMLSSEKEERYKPFDTTVWIERDDLHTVLRGGVPSKVYEVKDLVANEARVGIERDRHTKTVAEGQLYMTRHIRPKCDLSVVLAVSDVDIELQDKTIVRLGGEGRAASIDAVSYEQIPTPQKPIGAVEGVFFSLLTPALIDPMEPLGEAVTSACVGKAYREGGFDMQNKRSRAAKSYLPAGSTWFVQMDASEAEAFIERHHLSYIGAERKLGRGLVVCGYWTT